MSMLWSMLNSVTNVVRAQSAMLWHCPRWSAVDPHFGHRTLGTVVMLLVQFYEERAWLYQLPYASIQWCDAFAAQVITRMFPHGFRHEVTKTPHCEVLVVAIRNRFCSHGWAVLFANEDSALDLKELLGFGRLLTYTSIGFDGGAVYNYCWSPYTLYIIYYTSLIHRLQSWYIMVEVL